ncbi:ComEC/Rec2 family competence protein [Pseudolysinimonas yzui]|uniref:Membrane protein n=1 Tax=Pseudolysinimonas yzui TaxID=2708254 RepID=A0A8J3GSI0_9MICO|nr:ComEC/Rec2 family competence protein [Pseudolysinimonas yzui]GHF24731.1 membrane protein [Pseudolysinimonas yzui]
MPPRLRLLPAVVACWLAAGIVIGMPDAAPAATVVAAVVAAGLAIAALPARILVLPALAAGAATLVLGAVALAAPARTPTDLAEAADSGRSLELEVTVGGRADEGRFAGVVAGTSAPVLVFADPGTAPPIGATVALRADLALTVPGEDVAFLLFPRGDVELVHGPPPLLAWAHDIRTGFLDASSGLPEPGGGLLPGLAIGDTTRVAEPLDAAMKASSLSHLTAVSGANCAIVVGAVLAVTALLGAALPVRLGVAAVALLGFVVLVTPEPSVLRAAVMAGLALAAVALGRPTLGVPVLCAAVILLLIADPWLSRSYGFALSALATAGLLTLAGPLAVALTRVLPGWLATVLSVPLAAQLACQPVILLLDPSLPLYGVPANLLAAPAAPLATVLGLVACLLAGVAPPLGAAVAWLGWLPASWVAAVATLFAGLPGARGVWPGGPGGVALLVAVEVAALVAVLGVGRPRRLARAVSLVALVAYLAAAIGGAVVTQVSRPVDWQYAMCDVGQGDATLVRSGQAVALIDLGRDPELLRACLADLGIGRLDLVVLTHFDLDHVGGAAAVLDRADVVLTGRPAESADDRLLAEFAAAGAQVSPVDRGDRGTLGSLAWEALWPAPRDETTGNPASVALHWTCPNGGACLTAVMLADLGEEAQARMAGAVEIPQVDVVKVSHHGSADQSAGLYERLDGTVGLIGVGADNDYGHPTEALLGILAATGTTALRTDLDGLILVAPGDRPGEVDVWTSR